MKKFVLVSVLLAGLMFSSSLGVCAKTTVDEDRVVSEIGMLVNNGKYNAALKKADEFILKYPENAYLYYWKGTALSSLGNKKEAVENFSKSIEILPENVGSNILRGVCKYELDDYDGALADYNKAIELDPDNISAYYMRAGLKLHIGDLDGANADFEHHGKSEENN